MRPSPKALAPVVTLLSPSPAASRRAQEILGDVFFLEEATFVPCEEDALNAKFQSSLSATSIQWDSVASRCPNTGALLHWLSVENSTKDQGGFSLLGVTGRAMSNQDISTDILSSRALLASKFPSSMLPLGLRHFLRRPMTVDALLSRNQGLPVLDLPRENTATTTSSQKQAGTRLKEVVFATVDDAVYEDGNTVISQLSQSALSRPVTGLYEWPTSGVCLRPIPAAQRDLKGSSRPVVLTFHCESLEEIIQDNTNASIQFAKIGFTGQGNGQLRVQANNNDINPLNGLDVRWCEGTKHTSVFPEAQESLMASSLPELQSANVLKSTGKHEPGEDDARIGSADCWVEVRSMVQNPRGFAPSKGPKVATAPPSYPE